MIKIGKITLRYKRDFDTPLSYLAYKKTMKPFKSTLFSTTFLFIIGLFICYLNTLNSAFAFIIYHEPFHGCISVAMALAMAYYALIFYREAHKAADLYHKYERLIFDIVTTVEDKIKNDTQLEIPFEEFKGEQNYASEPN